MHVKSFQNALFLGLFHSFQLSLAQETLPSQCATGVHAILMRGQGPGDHLNVMVTVQNLVLQLIPGSSSVALPYAHDADDHRVAASNGSHMMQDYIRSYVASCPESKIFIHGFSLVSISGIFARRSPITSSPSLPRTNSSSIFTSRNLHRIFSNLSSPSFFYLLF